jgi:hypothetical protein
VTKRTVLGVVAVGAHLIACASGDAAPIDGMAADEGASGEVVARDEKLLAWSFEPASADCNGWPVLGAKAIRAIPSRSGAYSCKVCGDGSTPDLTISRPVGSVGPGRYVFSAWVRKRAATAAPAEATATIEAETPDGVVVVRGAAPVAVREEWDRVEAVVDLAAGATKLTVQIASPLASERCLFIDDVVVTRE